MRFVSVCGAALLVLVGCSIPANFDAAEQASIILHRQISAAQHDSIYDGATNTFKQSLTPEQLIAFLKRVNRKMGACNEATVTAKNIQSLPQGTYVTLAYSRKCANGELGEQITWQIVSGKALLNGLNMSSPLLFTD